MPLSRNQRTTLDNLLNQGKAAEAAKFLADIAGPGTTGELNNAKPPEPVPPRKPEEVILDLFKGVHQLLGNSPALVPLINELTEVLKPAEVEEAPAP